jgi:release factor glutamine methyltransferase
LWVSAAETLGRDDEARRIVQTVSGNEGGAWIRSLDDRPLDRHVQRVYALVARRRAGEPLQYVLGAWGFRSLDVMVDRRVLIPRPETEIVVEQALSVARQRLPGPLVIVDLGTGSGVIALSMASELPPGTVEVWGTDASADALDVARANLAGLGRAGRFVHLAHGDWFGALPEELRGCVDLVVTNPPYVAAGDDLPDEVARWEPVEALVAGPTGLEAMEAILPPAPEWLVPGGVIVAEIGATQGASATTLATRAGLVDARVDQDLAGRDRVLTAQRAPTPL